MKIMSKNVLTWKPGKKSIGTNIHFDFMGEFGIKNNIKMNDKT